MWNDSAETLFQSFLQEALVSSSGMGRHGHSLILSIQHFLCRPQCRPPSLVPWRMVLQRLLWCVTCPNHASFRLLIESCQKRLLWTHKEVDLAPHLVVGLVLQVGETEKFSHTLRFESLNPFFRVSKQGPCFTAVEEDGGEKRLVELEMPKQRGGKRSVHKAVSPGGWRWWSTSLNSLATTLPKNKLTHCCCTHNRKLCVCYTAWQHILPAAVPEICLPTIGSV